MRAEHQHSKCLFVSKLDHGVLLLVAGIARLSGSCEDSSLNCCLEEQGGRAGGGSGGALLGVEGTE